MSDNEIIHECFNKTHTEWSITGFLNESSEEPFQLKLDLYIKSLKHIVNSEQGKRREKAEYLLNKYYQKEISQYWSHWGHRQSLSLAVLKSLSLADGMKVNGKFWTY
ncbi:11037_t:CDS:2, partial [Acaulospora morrowiae]